MKHWPQYSTRQAPSAPSLTVGLCISMACLHLAGAAMAGLPDDVLGQWKLVSHISIISGQELDTHAALLQQRPCAEAITYEVAADKSFRLDASASACDDKYRKMQEQLYAKTKWKLEGNRLTTSSTNFAVGQTYRVSVSGNRMTWVGNNGQGTMVFQKK